MYRVTFNTCDKGVLCTVGVIFNACDKGVLCTVGVIFNASDKGVLCTELPSIHVIKVFCVQ